MIIQHPPKPLRLYYLIQDGGVHATCCWISSSSPYHLYQSPRRYHVRFYTHTYFKHFLGPFSGHLGLLLSIFEFPSLATYPHIFPTFRPHFLIPSSRDWDSWWLLKLLMIGVKVHVSLDVINPTTYNTHRLVTILHDGGMLTTCCRILSLLGNQIYQSPRRHLLTT